MLLTATITYLDRAQEGYPRSGTVQYLYVMPCWQSERFHYHLQCIILEMISQDDAVYHRIGVFMHRNEEVVAGDYEVSTTQTPRR